MSTQSLTATPSGYLLHGSYPVVDPSPQLLVPEPTTMAFDVDSFMESFKASLQPIFDEFKTRMLKIVMGKERRMAETSVAQAVSEAREEAAQAVAAQTQISAAATLGAAKRIKTGQPPQPDVTNSKAQIEVRVGTILIGENPTVSDTAAATQPEAAHVVALGTVEVTCDVPRHGAVRQQDHGCQPAA